MDNQGLTISQKYQNQDESNNLNKLVYNDDTIKKIERKGKNRKNILGKQGNYLKPNFAAGT